jgi:drug/metabolite transporter (DMT)-like permease
VNGHHARLAPVLGLLTGAIVWGLIWYPYRALEQRGLSGEAATFATYLVALAIGTLAYPRAWGGLARSPGLLLAIALASGWTNLAYVLGMLQGEVMRVLLLFYLAPLWTVPLARLLLHERLAPVSYAVVLLAVLGAATMLWRPELGWPIPRTAAEWLGLSSGFCFALTNVLSRRLSNVPIEVRSLAAWIGVLLISAIALVVGQNAIDFPIAAAVDHWPRVCALGAVLFAVNLAVQYGLTHTPALRAIVILLSELVVAAISARLLANEIMASQEWIGGAMIVLASLFSGLIKPRPA